MSKTDRKILSLQTRLTDMRKAGLDYSLPEVQEVLKALNALCT